MADAASRTKTNRLNDGAEKAINGIDDDGREDTDRDECDGEAWDALSKSFKQAQAVLDQNQELIQRVNENHKSKAPDNLVKNVGLIQEINGNITKVIEIYSDLSVNFLGIVRQRKKTWNEKAGDNHRR